MFKAQVSSIRLLVAKRQLEHKLAGIVQLMNGHKQAGLPAGHDFYKILHKKSIDAIMGFRSKANSLDSSNVPTWDEIMIGAPDLNELKGLAEGTPRSAAANAVGISIGILAFTFVVTMVIAMNHNLYLLLTHWVTVHWGIR